ncbi:MAG: alkaline phosphatase [Candidatus Eisenbacteria bacterium]
MSRRHRFSSSLAVAAGFAVLLPDGSPPLAARPGPERPPAAPRNIVLMISDGCGFSQIEAASLYEYGQTGRQPYESFPFRASICTGSVETGPYDPKAAWSEFDWVRRKPTDSAAAATALATGVKTHDAGIGVDTSGAPIANATEVAERRGKATGVVTSVPLSHATPAGFVAHDRRRDDYEGIARQMLLRSRLEVIIGCGDPWWDDDGRRQEKPASFKYVGGRSVWEALQAGATVFDTTGDGQPDVTIADADGDAAPDPWTFVQSREEFRRLADGPVPRRLCGVPQVGRTLQESRGGDRQAPPYAVPRAESLPTLAEMARAALNVLDDDPDGFFLMIEGGAIDWACHDNSLSREIEEEIDFNGAVAAVVDWVERRSSWDETLVVVTGDHETGYLTGPGSGPGKRPADPPVWKPLENRGRGNVPGHEWHATNHTNQLIPIFAKGPGIDRFEEAADETDPVRGRYLDNAEVGAILIGF